jgi:hypothetical protein
MNIYEKIQNAKKILSETQINKSGYNKQTILNYQTSCQKL